MNISHRLAILATIAGLCAVPAAALAADDDAPRVMVKVADLDLSHSAGRAALNQRVKAAIDQVCPAYNPVDPLGRQTVARTCRAAAAQGVQRQIAEIGGGLGPTRTEVAVNAGKH